MVYICVDKATSTVAGMVDIKESSLSEWQKSFDMIKADESFRGKKAYEIKVVNGKAEHATEEEKQTAIKEKEQAIENARLAKLKEDIGKANKL